MAGDLQKSYFVFQILPFLHRLTEFYKMCRSNAVNSTLENNQTKLHSKISSEFSEIAVFVRGSFVAAPCTLRLWWQKWTENRLF